MKALTVCSDSKNCQQSRTCLRAKIKCDEDNSSTFYKEAIKNNYTCDMYIYYKTEKRETKKV